MMIKIKNNAIEAIEWVAALVLTTGILFALVVTPALIELAIDTIL